MPCREWFTQQPLDYQDEVLPSKVRARVSVASHFDSNGNANGWMDYTSYLVFMACVGVLALVIVPGLGVLAARHPGRYLSIPNRR